MIRWSYLLPRLILVGIVTAFVCFALDPLLRLAMVTSGQSMTGAKVEIDGVQSSLLHTAVRIERIAVADPDYPLQDLVTADEIVLKLDSRELLKKNWIVDYGYVRGLRFNTDRATSGALEGADEEEEETAAGSAVADQLAAAGRRIFEQFTGDLEQQAEAFESVRLARELAERWPAEYTQLEHRTAEIQQQINELRALVRLADENPLEALNSVDRSFAQIDSLRKVPRELRGRLAQLQQQIHQDRIAIDQARRNDMEQIRERVAEFDFDAESLAEYLIGDAWSDECKMLLGWLRTARDMSDALGEPPVADRRYGREVLFARRDPQPKFLIRRLQIEGEGTIHHQAFQFAGVAGGITSQPDVYGRPARIKLRTVGAAEMQIEAIVDRTQQVPTSEITVEIPQLAQAAQALGNDDEFSVAVPPGTAHVRAHLKLTAAEQLEGRVVFERDEVNLSPRLPPRYAKNLKTDSWKSALTDVRSLHAVADFSGTVTAPKWRLSTNLGPQLAAGMNSAIRTELSARRDALAERVRSETDGQLVKFEQSLAQRHAGLLEQLNLGEQEIGAIKSRLNEVVKKSGLNFSRKLPVGDWLKKL
jgi:uncharacterized protein (TIGR03545 family)